MDDFRVSLVMSEPLFEQFWAAYPRKVGKLAARAKFLRLKPTPQLLESILAALAWQTQQPNWTKEHGQYVPHPATYLSQGRWMDEPIQTGMSHREFFRVHGYSRQIAARRQA